VSAPAPVGSPKRKPRRNWPLQGVALVVVAGALVTGIALSADGPNPKHQIMGSLELTGTFGKADIGSSCRGGGALKNVKVGTKAVLYGTDASKVLGTASLTQGTVTAAKTCLFIYDFGVIPDTSEYTLRIDKVPFTYVTKAELKSGGYQFKVTQQNPATPAAKKSVAKAPVKAPAKAKTAAK
jgi:hypothetical protein